MAMKGKWAEGEVRGVLSALEKELVGFAFNRIPDAHSGFMQPADADFQWFRDTGLLCEPHPGITTMRPGATPQEWPYTRNGVIEVKEVEHLYRLKHGNFGADKIARVHKRVLAGCEPMILVAHKLKGMRKPQVTWRSPPFQFFLDNPSKTASWDLTEFPLVDMEETIRSWIKR